MAQAHKQKIYKVNGVAIVDVKMARWNRGELNLLLKSGKIVRLCGLPPSDEVGEKDLLSFTDGDKKLSQLYPSKEAAASGDAAAGAILAGVPFDISLDTNESSWSSARKDRALGDAAGADVSVDAGLVSPIEVRSAPEAAALGWIKSNPILAGASIAAMSGVAFGQLRSGANSAADDDVAATSNKLSGRIAAGPVIEGNGLTVRVFNPNDPSTPIGTATVDADGRFIVDVGSYSGPVLVQVLDSSSGADYVDEATASRKDLGADLLAFTTVQAGSNVLNVNPLTTIAAMAAGIQSVNGGLRVTSSFSVSGAAESNINTAQAFGLSGDISKLTPVTVVKSDGSVDTSANDVGKVLAALSGMDKNQSTADGSNQSATQKTLSQVVAAILESKSSPASKPSLGDVANDLVKGAAAAQEKLGSGVDLVPLVTEILAKAASDTGASISVISVDGIISAAEKAAGVSMAGVAPAGSVVRVEISNSDGVSVGVHEGLVVGTDGAWKIENIKGDGLGVADGVYSVVATATKSTGETVKATRQYVLNTFDANVSITEVLVPGATGYASGFEVKAGDDVTVTIDGLAIGANLLVNFFAKSTVGGTDKYVALRGAFDGSETILVDASRKDLQGKVYVAKQSTLSSIDTTLPTLEISSSKRALKAGETAVITFTFSEAPTGFEATDIVTTNGTLSGLAVTTDPKVYTATFTPTANLASGTAGITVASAAYTDAASNDGLAGTTPSITLDNIAPA
ncbi:MAG: hypothetical protein RL375_3065, partial [Pseudomonadota bacterium]